MNLESRTKLETSKVQDIYTVDKLIGEIRVRMACIHTATSLHREVADLFGPRYRNLLEQLQFLLKMKQQGKKSIKHIEEELNVHSKKTKIEKPKEEGDFINHGFEEVLIE